MSIQEMLRVLKFMLWNELQPVNYITLVIWAFLITNMVKQRIYGKRYVIGTQKKGMDRVQYVYSDARLSENHRISIGRYLRHMF